jgi:predicted amidohydrolase
MALSDSSFATVLKAIFKQMRDNSGGTPKDDDWYADQLAKAIDNQIKTADVNAGITVDGGTVSGGNLVGCATSTVGTLS